MKKSILKLKELRNEFGLSCDDMAKRLNISKSYYWQIENQNRRLYYDVAVKIAAIFKLKPDDIFFDDN